MMTMAIAEPTVSPRKRPSVRASARKPTERVKATILLSPENDFRLTVLAASQGRDRSALVNEALENILRGVVVSFRGKSHDQATEEGSAV